MDWRSEMEEKCQKCGKVGYDRRTLMMACFYEMNELNIPFEKMEFDEIRFYTLRVCKDCRADWMLSIKKWWNDKATSLMEEPDSGYYVRHLGTTIKKVD